MTTRRRFLAILASLAAAAGLSRAGRASGDNVITPRAAPATTMSEAEVMAVMIAGGWVPTHARPFLSVASVTAVPGSPRVRVAWRTGYAAADGTFLGWGPVGSAGDFGVEEG